MSIEATIVGQQLTTERRASQRFARDDVAGRAHQCHQNDELGIGQLQRLFAEPSFAPAQVAVDIMDGTDKYRVPEGRAVAAIVQDLKRDRPLPGDGLAKFRDGSDCVKVVTAFATPSSTVAA